MNTKKIPMKNIEERAKYDEYKIKNEYDFSDGIRGRFYQPKKHIQRMPKCKDTIVE